MKSLLQFVAKYYHGIKDIQFLYKATLRKTEISVAQNCVLITVHFRIICGMQHHISLLSFIIHNFVPWKAAITYKTKLHLKQLRTRVLSYSSDREDCVVVTLHVLNCRATAGIWQSFLFLKVNVYLCYSTGLLLTECLSFFEHAQDFI